jgi:hypothetical protein
MVRVPADVDVLEADLDGVMEPERTGQCGSGFSRR